MIRVIVFILAAISALVIPYLVALLTHRVRQGTALVVTTSKGTQVSFTRRMVIPLVQRAEILDISVKQIEIERRGKNGLQLRDGQADVKLSFWVRVNATEEDVLLVARSIGCERTFDDKALHQLFEAKFWDAVRTEANKLDFDELEEGREAFLDQVIVRIDEELSGYVLDDLTLDYLAKTPDSALAPDNVLDFGRRGKKATPVDHSGSSAPEECVCALCEAPNSADAMTCTGCGGDPRLGGRYVFHEVLGKGAYGMTWRGSRVKDGLQVAIKELNVSKADSIKAVELFEREAKTLASLNHRAIPRYIDDLSVEQGRRVSLYLVQEYIDGHTLEQEMEGHRHTEQEVVEVLAEVFEAVGYLHGLRPAIVHRDIKPANIMRRRDGRLVLIDFGAVRELVRPPAEGGSTTAGTFGYMAPEQFAGQAGPATDIYALGVTAIRLLARREPHELMGSDHQLGWEDAIEVSAQTRALLTSMLDPDPGQRASSAQELAAVAAGVRS